MSNLEKLNKVLSNQKSTWEEEAKWREENEDWLSQSFDIAVRVLDTLRTKKMTQKELAEKMGVSPQFINKVLKGQENLSLETTAKLSRALGIKLIAVVESCTPAEVEYDVEQAYQVSEVYRRDIFSKASATGYIGLAAVQQYVKEQKLEYRMQS
jgi:transcriptional regulator with XRE-family HTH domain